MGYEDTTEIYCSFAILRHGYEYEVAIVVIYCMNSLFVFWDVKLHYCDQIVNVRYNITIMRYKEGILI